jgi:hypothetical protein
MAYSKTQLEAIWATANPGNGNPHLMAAIALAESGGSATVTNSIGACGLWQIHPYEAGCTSPMVNARMAGEKLRSQGLGAWETYTNGSYKQFYNGPTTKDAQFLGIPGVPNPFGGFGEKNENELFKEVEEGSNTAKSLGKAAVGGVEGAGKLIELLTTKQGWIRLGKLLIGSFLLLVGFLGMANFDTSSVPTPTIPIKKAAEVAAVGAAA